MTIPNGNGPGSVRPVTLWSVSDEGTDLVRFLGPYRGMHVHYCGRKPTACRGDHDCLAKFHRLPRQWKGYSPAEVYDQAARLWLPHVLEISECLEHQLRGRVLRGELWGLYREKRAGDRCTIMGTWLEKIDPATLRPAFPVEPVLARVYHGSPLLLDVANTLPARLTLAPSVGALPASLAEVLTQTPQKDAEPNPDDRQRFLEYLQKHKVSSAKNGKPHPGAPAVNGGA